MIEHLPKQCPLCGAKVSQSRFAELQAQIHEEERRKFEDAMRAAREELARAHRQELEVQAKAFRQQAEVREAQRTAELDAERERVAAELAVGFEERVARAVVDARAPLADGLAAAKAETQQLQGVVAELQGALASAEVARQAAIDAAMAESEHLHREQLAAITDTAAEEKIERLRLESVVADFDARLKALSDAKDAEVQAALSESDRLHREELASQRSTLEKDRDDQLLKEKLLHIAEDDKTQKRLADLQRQLEKKTADELGRGPEIDLYGAVQEEFKDDRVIHIARGEAGADIRLEIMHRGELCGTILIDSKNRKQWQERYADKLNEDRIDAKADHAVLASNVFPSGVKDLCLRPGVIVTRPLMVVPILRILRNALVNNNVHRLSAQQREQKAAKVYEYINGSDFRRTLETAVGACEQLERLDVDEKRDHENMWRKRGKLQRDIAKALNSAEGRLNEIIEAPSDESTAAARRSA